MRRRICRVSSGSTLGLSKQYIYERSALYDLQNRQEIIIKPAVKGSAVVVMDSFITSQRLRDN